MADDHAGLQGVQVKLLAQHGGESNGVPVEIIKIRPVGLHVVADHLAALVSVAGGLAALKGDMGVVGAAAGGPGAGVPAPHGPGQGLDDPLPAYKGVDALFHIGLVPAADKNLRVRLGHPGGVDHHPLGLDGPAGFIAVVFGKKLLGQIKFHNSLLCLGPLWPLPYYDERLPGDDK